MQLLTCPLCAVASKSGSAFVCEGERAWFWVDAIEYSYWFSSESHLSRFTRVTWLARQAFASSLTWCTLLTRLTFTSWSSLLMITIIANMTINSNSIMYWELNLQVFQFFPLYLVGQPLPELQVVPSTYSDIRVKNADKLLFFL